MAGNIPDHLAKLAAETGYHVEYRGNVRRRGWPQPSAKPFLLYQDGIGYLAAFKSARLLERNLRGRAGC